MSPAKTAKSSGSGKSGPGKAGKPQVTLPPLPIQEIGSLPKTLWRLKAFEKEGIDGPALDQARKEGKRLGIGEHTELVTLLEKRKGFSKDEKADIKRWASRYSLRYLEQAGLDIVYDGEETRTEMYDWPVARTQGFEERGWCRSWDHLYFKKAAIVSPPRCDEPYHTEEYVHATKHGQKALKVPVTGAYTLMDWSFDEYYFPKAKGKSTAERRFNARRQFAVDLARDVLRPNLKALTEAGATRIQVDEPGASTKPDEVGVFVESFNESVKGLKGRFSIHLCFSEYKLFFPGILGLKGCSELAIELANKDLWTLGTSAKQRPGYASTLALWKEHDAPFDIGLGVLDVHTDQVESPQLVRDRIVFAANELGPERVLVNPDCGLRTRRWPVVEAKLKSLVDGTRLARKQLGLA
jgi:5-methyltetrahydropteroyltriglutamate--homocysteine methyltransferase